MSQNSVNLVRVFCFEDGYSLSNTPIQKSPGNWDENGLKRIDLILSQAAAYGIYVIVVPTNFEPVGGGIQWYVDEVRAASVLPCPHKVVMYVAAIMTTSQVTLPHPTFLVHASALHACKCMLRRRLICADPCLGRIFPDDKTVSADKFESWL